MTLADDIIESLENRPWEWGVKYPGCFGVSSHKIFHYPSGGDLWIANEEKYLDGGGVWGRAYFDQDSKKQIWTAYITWSQNLPMDGKYKNPHTFINRLINLLK